MTEKEELEIIEEEEEEVEEMGVWSMDDLVELTEKVQSDYIVYRGKKVTFQFCELTEVEEPKFKQLPESASESKKMEMYQELGAKRCLKMILKANEKNPEGITLQAQHWKSLPTTLRYGIATKMMNIESEVKANFQN